MAETPRRPLAGKVALGLCLALAALIAWQPTPLVRWQERALDALLVLVPAPPTTGVTVIDIPRADDTGAPWSRAASARLAARLAEASPRVVGWDVVFAGDCAPTAANLALTATLSRSATVLGFLLANQFEALPGPAPALALGGDAGTRLWSAPGAEAPCETFLSDPVTLASLSLPGDTEARVRRVPAAVTVATLAWPSLPVEMARRARTPSAVVLAADASGALSLHLGPRAVPLDRDGTLRLRPRPAAMRAARTLDAAALLSGPVPDLADRVVIVGSSVPQRGGLRPTAMGPLYPSVQIAADLTADLIADHLPWRPANAPWVEAAALALAGLILAALLPRLAPLAGVALALTLTLVWTGTATTTHLATNRLYDPLMPSLGVLFSATAAILLQAALTARAERALRERMGQLLPAVVVARLANDPGLLRLRGERRLVTALFTDLEGFTAATVTMEPEALIDALDRYFTVVCAVILRHGGMIDKIVGDAVHALFNAPLDQPGHVDAALQAAAEIVAQTEALRASLGLGRTRIGIETGAAILGDVGSGARIDYTAHGACVNLAARLEAAGKALGPAVIIGPAAAAQSTQPLRALGLHELRGFGPVEVFTLS